MIKKIGIVLGTRPEAIKLIPVYQELKKVFPSVELVSTGQHFSMLEQIFNFFEVTPDISLEVMTANQTLSGLTARLTDSLQSCYDERKYDLVIVQGDTTTALTASLVAYYNRIKVVHVEAGLRTYNKYSPFPEEINRQLIGRIADFHFAPTLNAMKLLAKEDAKNSFLVGNTVIDSLMFCLKKLKSDPSQYEKKFSFISGFKKLILITGHRRENFGQGFDGICSAIKTLSLAYPDFLFYYPVHLNPNVKDKVYTVLSDVKNIMLSDPLPYDDLIFLMSRSYIILTDSGGIQEEAPSLNVPILVMRDTTERPEGIENGCALLVGTDPERIIAEFNSLIENVPHYNQMADAANPYGDGRSALSIAAILKEQAAN